MSFHEVQFPENIMLSGGPQFKTTVNVMAGGHEKRNIDWATRRGEWKANVPPGHRVQYEQVLDFFHARMGKAYGFRLKDHSDYRIENQSIGTGNGADTIFQIVKDYPSGAYSYQREIKKIVPDTQIISVATVVKTEGVDYTLDDDTGIVTFGAAPASGDIAVDYAEFDVPVRFDVDVLNVDMMFKDHGGVPNLPIVEIRV